MAMESMRELYRHLLAEAYDAERHALGLLDQLETEMGGSDGRDRVRRYRDATTRQIDTLERCMELLGGPSPSVASAALSGMLAERRALLLQAPAVSVLEAYDVVTLGRCAELAAAGYRTLAALASVCDQPDARRLFERAIREEEETADWCGATIPVIAANATLRGGSPVPA